MNTEKLNKWAELLLDTGKRNNLVNFKDTKAGTVEILSPNFVPLFHYAEHDSTFEVYDPKLEDEDDLTPNETLSLEQPSKEEYLRAYENKLKKKQILLYNADGKPLAALKNISKKAKSAMEETGVNIAYVAFGFLHWTEKEDSQCVMRAPLLLAPVTIENESSVHPHYVKVIGDEMIVNPTFAFKLQNEWGIKLPEYEDDGIEEYFLKIETLLSKLKWWISTECKIGIFSFLKLNMYKDLKDNAPLIVQNENIRALLGNGQNAPLEKSDERNHAPSVLDLHNVVDADSSQSEAIQTALQGKSFVLQGPPGTGKSQTITNVISECLLQGKRVLFVSEKLAALNVVYEKLKRAGLEEFCLELHSHKANKKQVVEELCRVLKRPKSALSDQAERELKAKKEAQDKLDDYVAELHKPRPVVNKTLYQLHEEASACRKAPDIEFAVDNIKSKGEEYIEKAEAALTEYVKYLPAVGYDYHRNVWYGYASADSTYQAVVDVKADLSSVATLCRALQKIGERATEVYGIRPYSLSHAHAFHDFFALAQESEFITPALLRPDVLLKTTETVTKMQALAEEILSEKSILEQDFDEDVFRLDGQALHKKLTRQFNGVFSRLFSGEYRRIRNDLRLCKKDGKPPRYKAAVAALEHLYLYQKQTISFNALEAQIKEKLGRAYAGVTTDFSRLKEDLQRLSAVCGTGVAFERLARMSNEQFFAEQPTFARFTKAYEEEFSAYGRAEKRLLARFDLREYPLSQVRLDSLAKKCEGCCENADKLDNWCGFWKLLQRLQGLELRGYIDYAIAQNVEGDSLLPAYKKAFYLQWIDAILHDSPLLLELSRVPHDEAIKKFREKDELQFEINKAKIKAKLSAQRPDADLVAPGSSVGFLLREGEKKRKQKGIRLLLSEIGELAQTLKPCFLMSPLSVSTYLSPDMRFDVVIFDEASQIFPQDAVGAIYRGAQLIVVGDSKQMPPSNFFNASADIDIEDEAESVTDFESILDLCATTFPQRRLKWHYRSRFEQLISFSNAHFYDNDLVTFPSSQTDKPGVGVDYVYVDGIFDRKTKTNRAEAEKIVDMVFEHITRYPHRSLGVVAFSIAQQNLIDKLLAKRRRQDPSKESFFKWDKEEPFFVKNLETVQGDERDTIIFSIAYAKDAQGKLLANFGPLNRAGGERRLNVAVTRAKYNVKIVASMHATDIDLSGSKSVGAKLLRDYLAYAEEGTEVSENAARDNVDEGNPFARSHAEFQMEVRDFLRRRGYEVDTQVGDSAFKIDLAVKRPNGTDYALAIECDGESYRNSKTTRDRDRLRQDILERMGWKFYRVWSTDWFRNKRLEQERLLAAVKEALSSLPKVEAHPVATEISFVKRVEEKRFAFPVYRTADELALSRQMKYDILRTTRAILEIEAPLSEEWLLKRIVFLFGGREKVTSVVREEFERQMRNCELHGILRRNGFLYLRDKAPSLLRVPAEDATPREIKYIPLEELASGLKELLKRNVTVEKSGLFKLLSSQLGFARVSDNIVARLEEALHLLSDQVEYDGEVLSLKTE